MAICLTNALLVDLDPPGVEPGGLRIDGDRIVERGAGVAAAPGDESVDCGGAAVLPGLVNGHTHLYSSLAVGMPPPPETPRNFPEILQYVWWRLDQALDRDAIEHSARIGALDALHCGTTTLIDHHASPNAIEGSLDCVQTGLEAAGLRGVLCYETTDRHGRAGRASGIVENRRFIEQCRRRGDGRFAGLVGAHASFTLEDESLEQLAALANETGTGVHIHVAEDLCDENDAVRRAGARATDTSDREQRGMALLDRLERSGLLRPQAVFAHGTHLGPAALTRVSDAGVTLAHNARSNMNNAVGYAQVASVRGPVMLGTDGIGGDMLAEARAAWFVSRDRQAGLSPHDILRMLDAPARRASIALGITLGRLSTGAAADVVITDYRPPAPLTSDNLVGHVLFGLAARNVRHVITCGRWALQDRVAVRCDESAIRRAAREVAPALWGRMARL